MKTKLITFLTLALIAVGMTANFTAPTAGATENAFIGTWNTTWMATDGRHVGGIIKVEADSVNADGLDGVIKAGGTDGVMYGTLTEGGTRWSGTWYYGNVGYGTFTFNLTSRGNFEGTYTQNNFPGSSFYWNGSKQ